MSLWVGWRWPHREQTTEDRRELSGQREIVQAHCLCGNSSAFQECGRFWKAGEFEGWLPLTVGYEQAPGSAQQALKRHWPT